ncbi:ATP-dependent RNA helicase SrmB [Alteromonas sp. ASW11-19]|uniref:ATP-dependent RNA helicase SrmB n=1 Tax=Alteromonas salexigens TaxID=2982530 RepID=A0ABT2VR06_9ALTE|nr:ATP-dependent RNA helicase SrmB [Alteromonas salexigens]MCU7554848.1 ATP-dependent RNA helicase SrmB [Alteromonas salexigens]
MTFDELELDDALCQAVADMGFTTPTSIQELVVPPAMEGKDILASAPTGTGKTAAFLLPACQFLLDYPRQKPGATRILILTPTRELALQVYGQAMAITKHTELVCGVITGGINYGTDIDTLQKNLDILVATPGRLFEHIQNEKADCRDIECLILDEADRMLDMGFSGIVNQIAAEARWRKQNMLFSATLEGGGVKRFSNELLKDPVVVEASPSRKEKNKIHQWYHLADDYAHKEALLEYILKNQVTNAIVFVKTRDRLQALKDSLASKGIMVCWLQGEMPQDKRNAALARFKSGDVPVLLATDVAARGIDVPNVSHVINFDMPRKADIYVHRVGRTGRAGAKGTAISLVEAHDIEMVGKASRYSGEPLKARVIDSLRPKHKAPKKIPKKKKASKKAPSKVKKKTTSKAKKKK